MKYFEKDVPLTENRKIQGVKNSPEALSKVNELLRFIYDEPGPWKITESEKEELDLATSFNSQILDGVTWKEFRLKFDPNLPDDQFAAFETFSDSEEL